MTTSQPAAQYHIIKRRIFYITLTLDVLLILIFFSTGLSVGLRAWVGQFSQSVWLINGGYFFCFAVFFYILHWPFHFYEGFMLEHRYRLSRQTFGKWWFDELKQSLLGFTLLLVLVEMIYFLIRLFPGFWWLAAGVFWLVLTLVLARIVPKVIIPLFYKYVEIEDVTLKEKIKGMFAESHVPLQDVYMINLSEKTKKANAFVCGLGRSRRVVLSDTLVNDFAPAEIEAVVAHELGHYKHKDILKLLLVNSSVILGSFYLVDRVLQQILWDWQGIRLEDIAGLPLVALGFMLLSLFTAPLQNAFSRYLETAADCFSLRMTKDRESFASMMKKLGDLNLAELEPSRFNVWMFYDHPPVAERIRLAEQFTFSKG